MTPAVHVWVIRAADAEAAARRALPNILRAVLGREPRIIRSEGTKPRLAGSSDGRFSVAHTDGLALVAVSRGTEVGVDVERLDARRVDVAVAARYLDRRLAGRLATMPPATRTRAFLRAWTELEATAKGRDHALDGMTDAPRRGTVVELPVGPHHVGALWVDAARPPRIAWHRGAR
jgi:4'-phosphopantetheinyl transferase